MCQLKDGISPLGPSPSASGYGWSTRAADVPELRNVRPVGLPDQKPYLWPPRPHLASRRLADAFGRGMICFGAVDIVQA